MNMIRIYKKHSVYQTFHIYKKTRKDGFTLIELLVTMGIIATLATLIFVSLDPVRRFAEARDSRRLTDVNSILTAIHEYIVDNDGVLPSGITTTPNHIGTCTSGGGDECVGANALCLNLSDDLSRYFKSIPVDPQSGTSETTKYAVWTDSNNIITVAACNPEVETSIQVSR